MSFMLLDEDRIILYINCISMTSEPLYKLAGNLGDVNKYFFLLSSVGKGTFT